MDELKMRGGGMIGKSSSSWPFATLTVTKDRMELSVTLVGNYSFKKEDIISIEPYGFIPVIGQGIRIHHRVAEYKEKVIFWAYRNPRKVINEIKQTGFWG